MINSEVLSVFGIFFQKNLVEWMSLYPGYFAFMVWHEEQITTSFFPRTEDGLKNVANQVDCARSEKRACRVERIPTHFAEHSFFVADHWISVCPNDGQTALISVGDNENRCPECGMAVYWRTR